MRFFLKSSFIFLLTCCFYLHVIGQVIFKNSGTNKVFVAYAAMQIGGGWTSRGWFAVEPGEAKSIYNYNAFSNRNFYYCARIENSDQGYYGNMVLYADNRDAFVIPNADKQHVFGNPNIIPLKFIAVNLGGQNSYTIELSPQNPTLNGQPNGKWRIPLDKDGEVALKKEDAEGYREITFSQGSPLGWCKDYFANGAVRASYKLLFYQPLVYDGKCTWYKQDGSVEKEITYQNGQPAKSTNYDTGVVTQQKQATYKLVTFPIRDFYVNSTSNESFKGGHSRVPYVINLPAGTVKWFYEFSASRNEEEMESNKANFKLAASLTRLVDQSGLLAASINMLGSPPGGNYCNVYVMDSQYYQSFISGKGWKYQPDASQLNLRSGIMEVNGRSVKSPCIGISNPDSYYGINVSIQVVAIVAVTE